MLKNVIFFNTKLFDILCHFNLFHGQCSLQCLLMLMKKLVSTSLSWKSFKSKFLVRIFQIVFLSFLEDNEKILLPHVFPEWMLGCSVTSSVTSFPVLTLNFANIYLDRIIATSVALFLNNFLLKFSNHFPSIITNTGICVE